MTISARERDHDTGEVAVARRHADADPDAEVLALLRQGAQPASRAEQRAAREAAQKRPQRPREPERWKPKRAFASVALTCAMFGLSMSWFMPWAMPVSILAVVLGSVALSRDWEDRAIAGWALGLGIVGTLSAAFWAGWIYFALQAAQAA
ncbi:hypothetical protein [Microbacterium halophytorum]|uniref:hypothetical protein n=1 Tax=Microbacterium halophytorum TaxID=2067568 RepID=UPI000CFC0EBF|nr:hypothetical protein [Microbacterium halophytorum]